MCRKKTTTLVSYVFSDKALVAMASPSGTISPLMLVTRALRRADALSRIEASTSEGASQGVEEESSVAAERIRFEIPRRLESPLVGFKPPAVVGAKASDQPDDAASNAADAIALKIPIAACTFDVEMLSSKVLPFPCCVEQDMN